MVGPGKSSRRLPFSPRRNIDDSTSVRLQGSPASTTTLHRNRGRRTHQGCLLRPPATGWRGHRTASVTSRSDRLRQGRAVSGQKPTPVLRRLCSVRLISLDRISNNIHHITLAAQQRRFRINALLDPKANTSVQCLQHGQFVENSPARDAGPARARDSWALDFGPWTLDTPRIDSNSRG
jgi:hypothetical protein